VKVLGQRYTKIPDGYRISVENTAVATNLIQQFPEIFVDYEITKGKMDDVFLAVTGLALTGGDAQ
jgi:multidrug/hemolysin transport system ATP-binding protein